MQAAKLVKRDVYYTHKHEWIDYQGSIAYIGVSAQKLKHIDDIQHIQILEATHNRQQGEIIAYIQSGEKNIPVHMPVSGRILSVNDRLLNGEEQILIDQPENNGWIALILPSTPLERMGLMQSAQYRAYGQ